jgi:hypothetical protein
MINKIWTKYAGLILTSHNLYDPIVNQPVLSQSLLSALRTSEPIFFNGKEIFIKNAFFDDGLNLNINV